MRIDEAARLEAEMRLNQELVDDPVYQTIEAKIAALISLRDAYRWAKAIGALNPPQQIDAEQSKV